MSSDRRSVGSPQGGGKSSAKEKGKRKLLELEVVGGKLSARGQLHSVMNDVRERLSDRNVEAFRRTCFGHLLDVPRIQPQMQLVFLMLNSLMEE
ncbi:hypothetical protein C2S51_000958 [Perilla frutescens var. frutescens]|nr:hypothetical protein C2S51_000958 [Perilla frutescens var. frutescens]